MSDTEEQNEFGADAQESVRADARTVMAQRGMSMTAVAKEADVAYGTFSAFMGGSYAGNNARVAASVRRWLSAEGERNRIRSAMPKGPDFVETKTAMNIIAALEFAQSTPEFVLVGAGAGMGKTTAARRYNATHQSVFLLTGAPGFTTARMALKMVAHALDLTAKYPAHELAIIIERRLQGAGALLIIDEAQHLSSVALDQIRTLHDKANVGVALLGNETVYSRIEGHARQPEFAQLYSRVGMRISARQPKADDISAMLDAWKIDDLPARRLLADIAKKPGALRGMTKTLRMASFLNGGEAPNSELIRRAWESISGTKLLSDAA